MGLVWHGTQEKYQDFDRLGGRFVSEFGMEAFPDTKTVDNFLPGAGRNDPERYSQSSTVQFHNKAAGHERRMATYLVENIRYEFNPIEQYIYSTQLIQAECVANAYRLWRREWKGTGREYCAGALVWQLNDCWPVTSWAIVDYYLRPKHAYYAMKRELAPLTVSLKRKVYREFADRYTRAYYKTIHKIEMWASNLTLEDQDNVQVSVKTWDIVTGKEKYSSEEEGEREGKGTRIHRNIKLKQNKSTELTEFEIPVEQKDVREESRTVVAAYLHHQDGKQIARCVNWPEPLKYAPLQKPKELEVDILVDGAAPAAESTWKAWVSLSAEIPVKGVALYAESDDVIFDDNCMDLVPGETLFIGVRGLEKIDRDKLTVRYLGS